METDALLRSISPRATAIDISAGGNKVFRLREESGATTIVKVYSGPPRERRERHALEALANVTGVPRLLARGIDDGNAWIQMTDGGTWDLATLPRNLDIVRSAGRVLRGVHESGAAISNLSNAIDNDQIDAHYRSTLNRLERFRRRLNIPSGLLEQASSSGAPVASAAKPSHTRPTPEHFLVNEAGGVVTLIDWEWATMAPPEWDVSLASWQLSNLLGDQAASAFLEGYGAAVSAGRLRSWISYHSAMIMLDAAEKRDGRLYDLAPLVRSMADAVGYR
ncbi:MAG TPA: aminoglycoside phosphotransferase family protein [Acidimicrobiia bacterium]|nr:aminoglycoside phosphotransferase family protein [Acidimicrobiia bacterium]